MTHPHAPHGAIQAGALFLLWPTNSRRRRHGGGGLRGGRSKVVLTCAQTCDTMEVLRRAKKRALFFYLDIT